MKTKPQIKKRDPNLFEGNVIKLFKILKPGQYQRAVNSEDEPTNFLVLKTLKGNFLLADNKEDMPDYQYIIQLNSSKFFAKQIDIT